MYSCAKQSTSKVNIYAKATRNGHAEERNFSKDLSIYICYEPVESASHSIRYSDSEESSGFNEVAFVKSSATLLESSSNDQITERSRHKTAPFDIHLQLLPFEH